MDREIAAQLIIFRIISSLLTSSSVGSNDKACFLISTELMKLLIFVSLVRVSVLVLDPLDWLFA
jgi:hypothetical protein